MIVEKFSEFYNNSNNKIDNIQNIINKIEKGFKFKFASSHVFCFTNSDKSILIFEQDSHLNIQNNIEKKLLKNIGGYNIYKIDKKLENPFFNCDNQYLESVFYFLDNDYFQKIKYFISKIIHVSEELNYYPYIEWNENIIKIKIINNPLNDEDYHLADRITQIWKNVS